MEEEPKWRGKSNIMDATASFLARTFTRQQTVFSLAPGWGNINPNLLSASGRFEAEDIQKSVQALGAKLNERQISLSTSDEESKDSAQGTLLPKDMVVVSVRATLRRFLKAREIDVEKAYEMITKTIDWRRLEDMATILDEPLDEELLQYIDERYPGYYCGFDKEGYPIYYEHTPGVQWLDLLDKIGFTESIRLHYKLMEFQSRVLLLKATNRASSEDAPTSNTRDKFVNVLDMHDLSLSILWDKRISEVLTVVSHVDQNNYPELLRRAYIINAPFAFKAAFAFVKPFLAKSTQEKIRVLGSKEESLDAVKVALGPDANLPNLIYHEKSDKKRKKNPKSSDDESDISGTNGQPPKAVLLLNEFLKYRKNKIDTKGTDKVNKMMIETIEEVAEQLISTSSYDDLKFGPNLEENDVEDNENLLQEENEMYQEMTSTALLSSEKSFRLMTMANDVADSTSDYMAMNASGADIDEDFIQFEMRQPLPTIHELSKNVWEELSADLHTSSVSVTSSMIPDSSLSNAQSVLSVELTSEQSMASVTLLCQFCKHAAFLFSVYGSLQMVSALAHLYMAFQNPQTSIVRLVDYLGFVSASGQLLLSYYIYKASLEFYNAWKIRDMHWHIDMSEMVRRMLSKELQKKFLQRMDFIIMNISVYKCTF